MIATFQLSPQSSFIAAPLIIHFVSSAPAGSDPGPPSAVAGAQGGVAWWRHAVAAPSEQRLIRNKSSFSVLVEVCLLPEWGQEAGRSWHPHSPLSPSELSASSGGCWARWAGWASWTPAPWAGGSNPSPPPPPRQVGKRWETHSGG